MKIFFTVNPGLSYLKDHTRWSHMAPMQFAFVWPLKLRLCMGLFFCTFAQFPALFQSQFVLLSIFLIIHGDLRAFRKHMARLQTTKVATGDRQPPFHSFLHLHTCAFSLISSACFLWQVTASMRRREGQALRRKRPRYTKPATHGRLLASFLASICTPIDF